MRRLLVAPLLVLLALPAAAGAAAPTRTHPVTVGDQRISLKKIRHWERIARRSGDDVSRADVVLTLIDELRLRMDAHGLGVAATREEVDTALEMQKAGSFEDEDDFRAFLRDSGQTLADIRLRVRMDLNADNVRAVVGDPAGYAAERDRYWVPRTRCAKPFFVRERCGRR